jgi:hypothetical protein
MRCFFNFKVAWVGILGSVETNTSWVNTARTIVSTSHEMAIWFKNLLAGSIKTWKLISFNQYGKIMPIKIGSDRDYQT